MTLYLYGVLQGGLPCPEVDVRVTSPRAPERSITLRGVLDTGAALSCIPEKARTFLGDEVASAARRVRDANGTTMNRRTIFADLAVGPWHFSGIELVILPVEYVLIGRDILNQYRLLLDGPAHAWSVA